LVGRKNEGEKEGTKKQDTKAQKKVKCKSSCSTLQKVSIRFAISAQVA
jgi:hypothetical protein